MKKISKIMLFTLLICMLPVASFASSESVNVDLPKFPISLNGISVDNSYREYPFITYEGITYLPLTYHDLRFLGIENDISFGKNIKINKTGVTAGYRDYTRKTKNNETDIAAISTSNIEINGKQIKSQYPLLMFREVLYLPLTSKFCADELGVKYKYDIQKGIRIESYNQKLKKENLIGYKDGSVILVDGHIYYSGENEIFSSPINNLKNFRKIYRLPRNCTGFSLSEKDGEAILMYHQGGADKLGADCYFKLKKDGTYESISSGYLAFKCFDEGIIKVNQTEPQKPNNLMIRYGDKEYKSLGNPDYLYGWNWEQQELLAGGSRSKDLYLIDNELYILGTNVKQAEDFSRIYKVNLKTNETTRVSDLKTESFKIDNEYIYAVSEGKLYKISLKNGSQKLLQIEGSISSAFGIEVLNDNVYYVNSETKRLYKVGSNKSLNPVAMVTGMKVQDNYFIATFEEQCSNPYRIMVFDKKGNIVFKTSDVANISSIFIEDSKLGYIESSTNNLYITNLF